jgi:hypothetical protein
MRLLGIAFVIGIVNVGTSDAATVTASSCASTAVQAAINSAASGDTVIIPSGACTWTSGVSISGKGVLLLGQSTAGVVITNNVGGNAVSITEDTAVHTQVGRMTIVGNSSGVAIVVNPHDSPNNTGGRAVLLHDLAFSDSNAIRMNTNRGVIYSITANNHKGTEEVVQCKPQGLLSSWTTPSTMGTADGTGESNVYVEDSTFTLSLHEAIDWDDNCRLVIRHNTFDNSSITSHGADTSSVGARHVEIYDNTFIFTNLGDCDGSQTANLAYFIFMRGATGVITDNTGLVSMTSCAWGTKPALNLTVMNLQRSAGPNPCWGQNSSGGAKYPAPRQVGLGYVTGAGTDGTGRKNDSVTYVGDHEPLYIWNQSFTPAISDYEAGQPDSCSGAPSGYDKSTNYLVAGRDFFNNGTPKPGYAKFAYPHPLRSGNSSAPSTPTNLRIIQ